MLQIKRVENTAQQTRAGMTLYKCTKANISGNFSKDQLTTKTINKNWTFRAKALRRRLIESDERPSLETTNSCLSPRCESILRYICCLLSAINVGYSLKLVFISFLLSFHRKETLFCCSFLTGHIMEFQLTLPFYSVRHFTIKKRRLRLP